ncbi:MAG: SGNH/GDSL hydrolase family protein [Verrucomicrobiota bacterium]
MPIRFFLCLTLITGFSLAVNSEEVSGVILPRDNDGMYVLNEDGQYDIDWTPETLVALDCNTRQFKGLKGNQLEFQVHSSKEIITFTLPEGPVTGIKEVLGGKHLEKALKEASDEKWIEERGLKLYFNQKPPSEQLATEGDLRFIGTWDGNAQPRTLSIKGKAYEISLKKGGQTNALLYNFLTVKDCKPFIHRARVIGEREENVIVAKEIHLLPIGDQTASDDPNLPRYLFIGDSISGNYDSGLREALKGQFNIHHPPTNCGPARNGAQNIINWLGAYDQPGRHWDVISFNHGHWDSGNDKESYQRDLEFIIGELKKTGAKLVWVTTCPVPLGTPAAGALDDRGKAPGRKHGVMEKYMNPWAAEVMARHPEISVCDQWQFVKDNADGLYKEWWKGDNVHFSREPADALGEFLADHVSKLMGTTPPKAPAPEEASAPSRAKVPVWNPDYQYQGKKAYGLYPEEEAAAALEPAWRGVERLLPGFPEGHTQLAGVIPDGVGGSFEIGQAPSQEILDSLKAEYQKGQGLQYYFLPKEDRYRNKQGLTGDEILADLREGRFTEDCKHVAFIYGFYNQNVDAYYRLFRVSGDIYYRDQIVKYAEGIEWILANRPQQLIPNERRAEAMPDPVAVIPHEPAAVGNFFPSVVAARLLVEGRPSPNHIKLAKKYLATTQRFVASQVTSEYETLYDRGRKTFAEGENTKRLREEYNLPPRAAQVIEYTPWNQTFFYFVTLAHAAEAMKSIQKVEGTQDYRESIELYQNICRAAMDTFQRQNICVIREGVPYLFHMHTPMRDVEPRMRLGFPMFGGEDIPHSGSGAINLPYLWEAGPEYGCTAEIIAGYTNTLAITLDDTCMENNKGEAWPRAHVCSPWYLAVSGRENHPARRMGDNYYRLMSFAPDIVAAKRAFAREPIPAENDLQRLYAGYLYRLWLKRRG